MQSHPAYFIQTFVAYFPRSPFTWFEEKPTLLFRSNKQAYPATSEHIWQMATQVVNLDNFVESDEEVDDALASSVATLAHTNGSSWALHAGETVIGRAEAADICMPDLSSLSSKHIRFGINAETQVCAVTDLGSTNGSQVAFPDGKTVKRICLPSAPTSVTPDSQGLL